MPPSLLAQVVTTVLTYLNAGSYYKTALEIQNAFNIASLQLYKKLRGNMAQYMPLRPSASINFQQTNVTNDALSEMYRVIQGTGIPAKVSDPDRKIDVIQSIEVQYDGSGSPYYPVMVVPDNQYLMILQNPIIPPIKTRPVGRFEYYDKDQNTIAYTVSPSNYTDVVFRCLTLPTEVDFTFEISTQEPLPTVLVGKDTDWSEDKYDQLVFMTVEQLGFNIQNGVLIQAGQAQEQKVL